MFETQESTGQDKPVSLRLARVSHAFVCVVAAIGFASGVYWHGLARPLQGGSALVVLALNSIWLVTAKTTSWKTLNGRLLVSGILLLLPRSIHDIFFP